MTGDAEFVLGDPAGMIFYREYPLYVFIFTGVEASGAVGIAVQIFVMKM